MDGGTRILGRAAGLFAAALAGGAIALGGAAVFGTFDEESPTIHVIGDDPGQPAPITPSTSPSGRSINDIYRSAGPGVVQITSTTVVENDPVFDPFGVPQEQTALGSGFVIDKAGYIVTNFHVVQGAERVEVSFSNKRSMRASVVGSDASTDIALLKVGAKSRALAPLQLGNSDHVAVGDPVVAIGNPFGLERTVTAGIVSALQREITAPNSYTIDHVIQTDAPINSGNSGGPLLDAQGKVIGVNSQIATGGGGGNVGIGFAVPINTVKEVVAQLKEKGRVDRAHLGVSAVAITPQLARLVRLPVSRGLIVQTVQPGSGAAASGLRGGTTPAVIAGNDYVLGGDILVKADGVPVASIERLRDLVADKQPGDTMKLEIYRGEKKMTLSVKLGRQPSSPRS